MNPDDYQQAWRAHTSQTRVTYSTESLLEELQREQQAFRTVIFWRDFREIGTAAVMLPMWFIMGFAQSLPWTWYLIAPAFVWVAGFILVDRMRHPQEAAESGEPLVSGVRRLLAQVEHQIWLLRNVFWWYLLPFIIPMLIFFIDAFRLSWKQAPLPQDWFAAVVAVATLLFVLAILVAVYGFVYFVNQLAVNKQLEPQRQELLSLLAGLADSTPQEVKGDYPRLMKGWRDQCSLRGVAIVSLCAVAGVLLLMILGMAFYFNRPHTSRPAAPEESSLLHRERSTFSGA
ncbi:MAG: hypothetical protein U0872_05275 [Planctomycetaceae bacterium]